MVRFRRRDGTKSGDVTEARSEVGLPRTPAVSATATAARAVAETAASLPRPFPPPGATRGALLLLRPRRLHPLRLALHLRVARRVGHVAFALGFVALVEVEQRLQRVG